eukprot:jgi/Tetstr1/429323/TSEL_019241.t1
MFASGGPQPVRPQTVRLGNGANSAFRAPWAPGAMPLSQRHVSPSGADIDYDMDSDDGFLDEKPRSGAATNTLTTNTMSTPEKELMMAKASNEKKNEMRFDQKLPHSEQREAEKGKRRKCDLISITMRSDAAQLLTEDNKAALRERIMSITMHDD